MRRNLYIVPVSVRSRLFWSVVCGLMSYEIIRQPIRKLPEDYIFAGVFGVGLAVLCVMAFVAAMQLLFLKITVIFWHV